MNAYHGYRDRSIYQATYDNFNISSLTAPIRTILVYIAIATAGIYYLLMYFDYPMLPIQEILWNCLVYLTPTRLIAALDQSFLQSDTTSFSQDLSRAASKNHAAKSAVMRRVLGLDKGGLLAGFRRARSFSGLGIVTKKEQSAVPPGLGNWDNSCYQNSVIQGLASLESFREFLGSTVNDLGQAKHRPTRRALRDIIDGLNDLSEGGRTLWTPAELKSMSSWQQQDAQEYLSKVVDELEKELLKTVPDIAGGGGLSEVADLFPDQLEVSQEEVAGELFEKNSKSSTANTSSVMEQRNLTRKTSTAKLANLASSPLEGLLAQRVGCLRCGHVEGLSLIPFNCLTVPLGKEWGQDIERCLEAYTALEQIEGVECAKCTLLRTKAQLERLLYEPLSLLGADDKPTGKVMSPEFKMSAKARLITVNEAIEAEDFSENTISKKCQIPSICRVSTTKSRQAVVARAPSSLVVHVNRSVFDESSGVQRKNYAAVTFPERLDIAPWCLGAQPNIDGEIATEEWITDPNISMIPGSKRGHSSLRQTANYGLKAIITHYGRHENGHYICYRKHPFQTDTHVSTDEKCLDAESDLSKEPWWRFSDDEVTMVSRQDVLDQGGVFMLFYERLDDPKLATPEPSPEPTSDPTPELAAETMEDIAQSANDEATPCVPGKENIASNDEFPAVLTEQPATPEDPPSLYKPPPMRTAGPRRKARPRRRAGNVMASTTSSMISAN
ncbi:hypothetical protein MMC16_002656 [Acarospora aff. strigata]|nr:hypothetical protein [Acarospora aff. strigata]